MTTSFLGLGAGIVGKAAISCKPYAGAEKDKLFRDVCLVGIDLKENLSDTTSESRIEQMLNRMESVVGLYPGRAAPGIAKTGLSAFTERPGNRRPGG